MAVEEVLRAYKFALDPAPEQISLLQQYAGAARFAFNHAIAAKRQAHRTWLQEVAFRTYEHMETEAEARARVKIPIPSAFSHNAWLTTAVGEHRALAKADPDVEGAWMHRINRFAFTTAMQDADKAWKNWMDSFKGQRAGARVGYPRFKKRGRAADSFRIHHDVKQPGIRFTTRRRLRVPTFGEIRTHQNAKHLMRKIAAGLVIVQSVTVSRAGDRWYASLLVKQQQGIPASASRRQQTNGVVGVDLGVHNRAALSTGEILPNPKIKASHRRKLTKLSRAYARTRTGSENRAKVAKKIAALHHLEARQRQGHTHQLTNHLARNYAVIGLEDLNVACMTRSAKGTTDNPGTNVRQKSGLNRNILDAGFGEIRRQLEYKTLWTGSRLNLTNRWAPTSKTCSDCGQAKTKLPLNERTYHCDHCGLVLDRDIAALAVLPVAPSTEETQNASRGVHPEPQGQGQDEAIETGRPDRVIPPEQSKGIPKGCTRTGLVICITAGQLVSSPQAQRVAKDQKQYARRRRTSRPAGAGDGS